MVDNPGAGGGGGASTFEQKAEAAVRGKPGCKVCGGSGGWEDPVLEQSVLCPVCRAFTAEHLAMSRHRMAGWVPSEFEQLSARYPGPMFSAPPWLLVVHSGSSSDRVAEYLSNPGDDRVASAHVSYSRTHRGYVQQVPFNRVAWHCGGSVMKIGGKRYDKLNFCSIGIERPGPPGEHTSEREQQFVDAVRKILRTNPTLRTAARHSDLDRNKADPGISIDFLADEGLSIYRRP